MAIERPSVHAWLGAGGEGNSPNPARDETRNGSGASRHSLGDATGTRSESPCQDVLYYNAHLAFHLTGG